MAMHSIRLMMAAVALSMTMVAAHAHHSVYGNFDVKRLVEVKGKYVDADLINPHAWFHFEEVDENGKVKVGADGKPVVWSFETPGPAGLRRMGITPSLFTVGDVYTIYAPPALDGSNKGLFLLTIFPDGRRLFMGNPKDPIFAPFADKLNAGQ
jgi:Family of unknown function (DUF6152)